MPIPAIKRGSVEIKLGFELPADAGRLDAKAIRRLPKPPAGLAHACTQVAHALQNSPASMVSSPVRAEQLRVHAERVESMEALVADVQVLAETLSQALLLVRDDAYTDLRRLYLDVKAAAKFDERVRTSFEPAYAYFHNARTSRTKADTSLPEEE